MQGVYVVAAGVVGLFLLQMVYTLWEHHNKKDPPKNNL